MINKSNKAKSNAKSKAKSNAKSTAKSNAKSNANKSNKPVRAKCGLGMGIQRKGGSELRKNFLNSTNNNYKLYNKK